MVEDHVNLVMAMVFPYGSSLFQFDIAPWYTTKIVKEWFKKHEKKFKVLHALPNSPDLSPIEHLLDVLERV